MGSLLRSTRNTRALPTGSLRYIRSDVPDNLTDTEIRLLMDNQITTIVDLRSDEETSTKPCCLAGRVSTSLLQGAAVRRGPLNICMWSTGRCWTNRWIASLIPS